MPRPRNYAASQKCVKCLSNHTQMLTTYFKLAFRNILKDRAYSVLNISGLAIGLASGILILLWVQNERKHTTWSMFDSIITAPIFVSEERGK